MTNQGTLSWPLTRAMATRPRDVTEEIARELRARCGERGEVPRSLQEFLEHHER